MLLISCHNQHPSVSLEKTSLLVDFPSGSSIEYFDNRLYLIGDDAKNVLILDAKYNRVDSIPLFPSQGKRIAKSDKADFEASVIVGGSKAAQMLIFGSGSTRFREKVAKFTIANAGETLQIEDNSVFYNQLQDSISIINIEGAAAINGMLVLANRANASNPVNHLVVTTNAILNAVDTAEFTISTLEIGADKNVIGLSGLTYLQEADLLLFTASTEFTATTYSDGKIGDSYIGWVKNASKRIKDRLIKPDGFINLARTNKAFSQEKIESVCVENFKNKILTLHLISDNDNGETRLFKVKLQLDDL